MTLHEHDLERIIMESNYNQLYEKGLWGVLGHKRNQVRIGNYGIADIVTYARPLNHNLRPKITVWELKKDALSISAFFQAVRYLKGIQRYFIKTGRKIEDYVFTIGLIGGKTDNDLVYLGDLLNDVKLLSFPVLIYFYDYDLDGIQFREVFNYHLINEGF